MERERKISRQTLERLPVASGTVSFEGQKPSLAVIFNQRAGFKARSIFAKKFTCQVGTKDEFWNLEAVLAGKMRCVYITEGALDACALVEAGIDPECVLASPSATLSDREAKDDETSYVEQALAMGLGRCKKFVWCGDQDEQGLILRKRMVKLLGIARFFFIEWPEGTKDANEFLKSDGPEALRE